MEEQIRKLFSQPTAEWFEQTLGEPTEVQKEAWPAIAGHRPVLVSAPTGTGKTLSAFLIFIDRLKTESRQGTLRQELQLLYISPLKSLASDIRENLRRPLLGIAKEGEGVEIEAAVRTGDTPQKDRRRMAVHPPHILITTPESLFLMLTSGSGQKVLKTAKAVVIDELHALIDTKRGAHLLLSIARLERLCGHRLQRIGLSATIEPLPLAAQWLSPEEAVIVAPSMKKKIEITVVGTTPAQGRKRDPVWEELAQKVYERCRAKRSVIAFSEGRRYAEKLAYYVNQIAGEDFARVHHGSLSKDQRNEVEQALREGRLRLLCATSSMELGIDVGEIDEVLQIGCPRTVSSTMQRLGRAGHNPGRVSVMNMYPRTASEGLSCGMTAVLAKQGGVEEANPPRLCLDVLAQHLVSMAGGLPAGESLCVDDIMELLQRAWSFREVTRETVGRVLAMLAGDYEHQREIPVRPRIIYDRIHDRIFADSYSRMLAVAAGGTIPDKGLYAAKTLDGVKLGELDEEFVYESYVGDRFLLGSFAWKIVGQDKDTVFVEPARTDSARVPFWKGEIKGRSLKNSLAFGKMFAALGEAGEKEAMLAMLAQMGLDAAAGESAADFLCRQIASTSGLPDDKTIIAEHFCDHTGSHQVMLHSLFGRRINGPLAILAQHAVRKNNQINIGCVDEESGILLYAYGEEKLPEGILFSIDPGSARSVLEAILPQTPAFSMTFRYNAARALMMGMRRNGRQPLWMQRLRSTEMLDSLVKDKEHPLIVETRRECLEEIWDIEGVLWVLSGIRSGLIAVREVWVDVPSPMSLPLQWQVEAAEMYEYTPVTPGIRQAAYEELKQVSGMKPSAEELERVQERKKMPENSGELHTLLMMEGDLEAGELEVPFQWLEELAQKGLVCYIEPGLWIAAEQREEYETALAAEAEKESASKEQENGRQSLEAAAHIVRRMLYYRGPRTAAEIGERYIFTDGRLEESLKLLQSEESVVEDDGIFYHAKLYRRAQQATVQQLRKEAVTQPAEKYAALIADKVFLNASGEEQLQKAVDRYCGQAFPAAFWEEVLFPVRVKNYREAMLDHLLAEGEYYWQLLPDGRLRFERMENADWDVKTAAELSGEEKVLYEVLDKRGASFLKQLSRCVESASAQEPLLALAQKGLVCADSFVPVRQWLNRDKIAKATVRQRISARVMAQEAGRWELVRPLQPKKMQEWLEQLLRENMILCRETFRKPESAQGGMNHADGSAAQMAAGQANGGVPESDGFSWSEALKVLRVWEYVGKVRRGYFVAGLSGAQFIRKEDYAAVTRYLAEPKEETRWLNAADPAQIWGKVISHREECRFLNVPQTAVALRGGRPAVVFERKGRVLRIFSWDGLEDVLHSFVRDFKGHRLFAGTKRLVVKEYPEEAGEALGKAGFMKEMQDYVLYV